MTRYIPADAKQVKFADQSGWWVVQARDDRWTILTRGTGDALVYTIVDEVREVRGPCDLVGGGWDFQSGDERAGAQRLLRALNLHVEVENLIADGAQVATHATREVMTQVSRRNNVPITVELVR